LFGVVDYERTEDTFFLVVELLYPEQERIQSYFPTSERAESLQVLGYRQAIRHHHEVNSALLLRGLEARPAVNERRLHATENNGDEHTGQMNIE
jgi:hypothetical protein